MIIIPWVRQQELQQSSDSRLGPTESSVGSALGPVVWGIALACWLRSVTMVYQPVEEWDEMGKSQSSTNEDFFWQMKMMDTILTA